MNDNPLRFRVVVVFGCLMAVLSGTYAQQASPEKELSDLQRKIRQTREEIQQTRGKIDKDKQEYAAYEKRNAAGVSRQRAELDSLKRDVTRVQRSADSLAILIQRARDRQREYDLLQKNLAQALREACAKLAHTISALPPGNVQAQRTALSFLEGELASGAVDNVEALERFWQILLALEQSGRGIETYAGASPIGAIKGQVDFIRLGHAYLAIVNEKADAGALWVAGNDTSGGEWLNIDDAGQLFALKKAVKIRQGNAVPDIVNIPYRHVVKDDISTEQGDRP